jgi:hypothetical protein
MFAEDRQAIDERAALIESRALALATAAVDVGAPWARRLGTAPTDAKARTAWMLSVATVAAYRDRYRIESDLPTGGGGSSHAQGVDRRWAQSAAREAQRLATATGTGRSIAAPAPAISLR